MKKHINTEKTYQIVITTIIIILLICSVFPLLYVVGLSFTGEAEWIERGNTMIIPYKPTLQGYQNVLFKGSRFTNAFYISVLRTTIGTVLVMLFTLITGYAASRKDLPGRKIIIIIIMITVLFTGGLIPTFLVVKATGIYDTFFSMILPGLVYPWGVLVFKQFFENLPNQVEESAYIDGASEFALMTRIIIPMSKPVIAALAMFIAVGHWNQWFDALIYLQNEKLEPLQLLLRNMFQNTNIGYNMNSQEIFDTEQRVSSTSIRMVITVIGTVPILAIFPFLQKYFTKGVYTGSVKG
ncbi:carbohydrate ABC transporter permease [Vallitalea sediminicola]